MRKLMKNTLIKKSYMSFLEVAQQEPCEHQGSVHVIIKEYQIKDNPCGESYKRYIKLCDASCEDKIYEILIDENTHIGELKIENIEEGQISLIQVDACGQQVVNGDDFCITYYVNDKKLSTDYAEFTLDDTSKTVNVEIINQEVEECTLQIKKMKEDDDGNIVPIVEDQEYSFILEDQQEEQFQCTLNKENNFQTTMCHLLCQRYEIKEENKSEYYVLNNQCIQKPYIDLNKRENILECIIKDDKPTELIIEKWIRNANGALHHPSMCEEYQIQIISDTVEKTIQLNSDNQYSVVLTGLDAGFYDLNELMQENREIYYSINGEVETTYANVELHPHERVSVMVIEDECQEESCIPSNTLLRICKYMKHYDGCVDKPNQNENFKIMLVGCGQKNTFYLNEHNNYCVELADLCEGTYEILECDNDSYITTYCINGGRETTSASICLMKGIYNEISIMNEEKNKGSVNIYKYIRNEHHELIKPNDGECFYGCLSSCFGKQEFTLCKDNDWCIGFENLRYGSYEVREYDSNEYNIRYQVNNRKEESFARFVVDRESEQDVKIINCIQDCPRGTLKIYKYIETEHHQIAKPQTDEIFEIKVEGPCFDHVYTLCSANHWCVVLEGLKQGEYQVYESNHEEYDVHYFVNRISSPDGYVYVGENNQEVCIVNHQKHCGSLKLYKVIRDIDGCMHLPSYDENFDIYVESKDICKNISLNYQNGWCVMLDDLPYGNYQVIEKDALGYRVSYCVNGVEKSYAKFHLDAKDIAIGIINENTCDTGNVNICGVCDDGVSTLDSSIVFTLYGRGIEQKYELNSQNHYQICFDDLEEGKYRIEADDANYYVDGKQQESGYFVLGKENVNIQLEYACECSGNISIEKVILCNDEYEKPDDQDCFKVLLKGKHIHQIYELNKTNNFSICLEDMPYQHYEISELGCRNKQYCINGTLQNHGYFLYQGEQMNIQIINEPCQKGCVEISKLIEDYDGTKYYPQRWESFEIMIENDEYKQKFVLSHENDFMLRLYDLPYGKYCIYEKNAKDVTYEIQGKCQTCGNFCVDDEDVSITIINHIGCKGCLEFEGYYEQCNEFINPNLCDQFHIIVENEENMYKIELNNENDFYDCLYMLPQGIYKIHSTNDEMYDFIVDDQRFEDEAVIGICNESAMVKVIKKQPKTNVYIDATIQDEKGDDCCIPEDCVINIEVIGNDERHCYSLSEDNNWRLQLNLSCGRYRIKQYKLDGCCSPYYLVNGAKTDYVDIEICNRNQFITCVNCCSMQTGSICITKKMKDAQGCLKNPENNDEFTVIVSGGDDYKKIKLTKDNNWTYVLCNVEDGRYQIQEQTNGYHVSYIVNEQDESDYANLYVHHDHHQVIVVNEANEVMGSMEICKLLKDEDGCYCYPDENQQYWVNIVSNQFNKRICLNKENHFQVCMRCLKNGIYEVFEESDNEVMYIVNNGTLSSNAKVSVENNANTVKIINPCQNKKGSICISKYIQKDGMCVKPDHGTYCIQCMGNNKCEQYELNKDNNYYLCIEDLECGLYEIKEMDHDHVVYSVDQGLPKDQALVQVHYNNHDVQVINRNESCGKITLIKYIRENGQLKKPSTGTYVFRITKPLYSNTIVLNDDNDWTITLDHLQNGMYTIAEVGSLYNVSYITNGESETSFGVVKVKGNENVVQIINEKKCEDSSIVFEKYIRKGKEFVKPSDEFEAKIQLSGPDYKQDFLLNKDNNWTTHVKNLQNGMYHVEEFDGKNVRYVINGKEETSQGIICVCCGTCNNVSIINEEESDQGSIKIQKYIRYGMSEKLLTPPDDFYARILITKPGYRKYATLGFENNFTFILDNLENGIYTIQEIESQNEVSYRINGQAEVAYANVHVNQNENTVMMINTLNDTKGSINIRKVIENKQGEQVPPQENERFVVVVSSQDYYKEIVLAKNNQWTVQLENLNEGIYKVYEAAQQTYDVSYCVGGICKEDSVEVYVERNQQDIVIVNKKKEAKGTLQLTKYMKQPNGTLIRPANGDDYTIEIINASYQKRISLNGTNAFTKVLFDLPEGIYSIREINQNNYTVTYRLNGGEIVDDLEVVMTPETRANVDVINERTINMNVIDVYKYMLDQNDEYILPKDNEKFQFEIIGSDGTQSYELNKENEWHVTLNDYASGKYQIKEMTSQYEVQYLVNSPTLTDDAYFEASAQKTNIIGIINKLPNVENGTITITKRIKTVDGNLIIPNEGNYVIKISDQESEKFEILNQENKYEKTIDNLPYKKYQLEEVSSMMDVYYIVDGEEFLEEPSIDIKDNKNHEVIVVNVEKQTPKDIKIVI